jgi:HSP20 family protein
VAESKKRSFVAATLSVRHRGSLGQPGGVQGPFFGGTAWLPPVYVYETDSGFIVIAEIAGVEPSELEVVIQGQVVRISGVRSGLVQPETLPEPIRCIHHRELDQGPFEREVLLPCPIDSARAVAQFRQGLVRIHVTKAEALPHCEPRSIKVD